MGDYWGIIGARLFHVIDYLGSTYISNPMQILQFWYGLSIFGAILGGTLAVVIYARISNLHFGHFADAVAPAVILAQAIGRIGCTINGDAWGAPTSLPWAFVYIHPNAAATLFWGEPTHPSPLYEIIWGIYGLRRSMAAEGTAQAGWLVVSALPVPVFLRAFLHRVHPRSDVGAGKCGWRAAYPLHFVALIVMAVCIPLLIYRMLRARAVVEPSVLEDP